MKVIKHEDMKPRAMPPHHQAMASIPIHKFDNFFLSMSVYLPGGSVDKIETTFNVAYFVLEGEMTVITESGEKVVLHKYDAVAFDLGDIRTAVNESNMPAIMLIIRDRDTVFPT